MANQYSDQIAKHYAAFRPALHGPILRRLIRNDEHFQAGLDIGCGTGYSAIALTEYCDKVFGLDPSQAMLDEATPHPRVSYVQGSGEDLSVVCESLFAVITFAGSLSYLKTNRLRSELLRTLAVDGVVLVYDFQVLLESLAAQMGVSCCSTPSGYNYMENLSDWPEFASEGTKTERISLDLSVREATHLLLANSDRYTAFQELFPGADPFERLTERLLGRGGRLELDAEIYFSRHSLF